MIDAENPTVWPLKLPNRFEQSRRIAGYPSPEYSSARPMVKPAEREREIVEEDVDWGLNA
jgi:hypothetical protein